MKVIKTIFGISILAAFVLFLNGCIFNKVVDIEGYKLVEVRGGGYAIEELPTEKMNDAVYEVPEKIGDYDIVQLGYERKRFLMSSNKMDYGKIRKLIIKDHIKKIDVDGGRIPKLMVLSKTPSEHGLRSFKDINVYILGPKENVEYSTVKFIEENNIYDDFIIEKNDQGEIGILYYFGEKESKIPEMINGSKVTSIEDYAFEKSNIENIKLSHNLKNIGREAFSTVQLKEIFIPNSIVTVGIGAFRDNENLSKIEFEEGIQVIHESMFSGAGRETETPLEIILPSTLIEIKESAFYDSNLQSINLPSSIKTIERHALSRTKIEVLEIPKLLTILENIASDVDTLKELHINEKVAISHFFGVYSKYPLLEKITVDSNNKIYYMENQMLQTKDEIVIAERSFKEEKITINRKYRPYGFYNVKGIKEIILDSELEYVEENSFASMADLEKVTLSNKINRIKGNAFADNSKLKEVNLENVEYIGFRAFFKAEALEIVNLANVIVIGGDAFSQTSVKSIYIPKTCIRIEHGAFDRCTSLETVVFQDSGKTSILRDAFSNTPYQKNKKKK